jgi:hypothetical protein
MTAGYINDMLTSQDIIYIMTAGYGGYLQQEILIV